MAHSKTESREVVKRLSVPVVQSNEDMEKMGDRVRMLRMAAKDVENASGMRLRIATDALLETYVTNNASRQTGTVTKTPAGDGSYTIELTLEPWYQGQKDVQGVIAQNIAHFNQRQNAIAAATKCH